jgi:hypothetical protein
MPVKPKRRPRFAEFDWPQLSLTDKLSIATGRLYAVRDADAIRDDDDLKAAWFANRDRKMWIDRSYGAGTVSGGHKPGTRPACWWKFEALEGRRVVGRGGVLAVFVPDCSQRGDWRGDDDSRFDESDLEPEADYLRRLGLLTPEEI